MKHKFEKMEKRDTKYNIFRLYIKFFILNIISLFSPKSSLLQDKKAEIKYELNTIPVIKVFKKSKKKNYKDLFYYLSPMPSISFLDKYYKYTYLNFRKAYISSKITAREINQLDYILNSKKNFDFKNKEVLNFGIGEGGFSFLASVLGARVTEIDYKGSDKNYYDGNISSFEDLSNVQDKKFDLIYASHSLEHITDISFILKILKKISHDNTFYYFEVPNGKLELEYLSFPHTYFFFKKFFEKIFFQKKNRDDHFLNIVYRKRDSKIDDKESDDLVIWTNHSLNTDF